jgi:hypothetical protein
MPVVLRHDLPRGPVAGRPIVPLVLRTERTGGSAILSSLALRGDTVPRLLLGADATDRPTIKFGAGGPSAADVSLTRSTGGRVNLVGTTTRSILGIVGASALTTGLSVADAADTTDRAFLGFNGGVGTPWLEFGPGNAARDLRFSRASASNLQFDDAAATPGTTMIGALILGHYISQRTTFATYFRGQNQAGAGGALDTGYRWRAGVDAAGAGGMWADNGTVAGLSERVRFAPGGQASIAATVSIGNTETNVVTYVVPATFLQVGTVFRIRFAGVGTSGVTGGSSIFRVRIGAAGTPLAGNIACSITIVNSNSVTNQGFSGDILVTVRTTGAGGTVVGDGRVHGSTTAGMFTTPNGVSNTTATVAVDTTVDRTIGLTYLSGNAGTTLAFHIAAIEIVKAGV